jgi:hypothetical protein
VTAERHAAKGEGPWGRVGASRERRSSAQWCRSSNSLYLWPYGLKTLLTTHRTNVLPVPLFNEGP